MPTEQQERKATRGTSTDLDVAKVLRLREDGVTENQIARRFGVSVPTLWRWARKNGLEKQKAGRKEF